MEFSPVQDKNTLQMTEKLKRIMSAVAKMQKIVEEEVIEEEKAPSTDHRDNSRDGDDGDRFTCGLHPYYKAKKEPLADCKKCWTIWELKQKGIV